ncbi:MAG: hypothetical protein EBT28_06110 [Betaproteobacteria bacterium]|nr:hypothetical protein [Betaproteobacteria bacterium]
MGTTNQGAAMSQDQAHFAELLEISKRIQSRQISSVEATQAQLKRIGLLDGSLKSYATVMAEHALADAQAADKAIVAGQIQGPLHGHCPPEPLRRAKPDHSESRAPWPDC